MKTKTRAAKGAGKKSAGRKAPTKKATVKKSTAKKATAKKATAKKPGKKKVSGKKVSGSKSAIRKAVTPSVEDSVPTQQGVGSTNGEPAAGRAKPGAREAENQEAQSPKRTPILGPSNWGDLMHRVIEIVDPSALREKSKRPRALDERPIGRWVAASFLAGCLFGWVLAAVL